MTPPNIKCGTGVIVIITIDVIAADAVAMVVIVFVVVVFIIIVVIIVVVVIAVTIVVIVVVPPGPQTIKQCDLRVGLPTLRMSYPENQVKTKAQLREEKTNLNWERL